MLFYSFFVLDHIANPIVPNASPATDAPHEKKFKKNVDSNTWMRIKKGRRMPKNIRIKPRLRRRRGLFIMVDTTNRQQNDPVLVQNPLVLFHHTILQWLSHNADGSGIPLAG